LASEFGFVLTPTTTKAQCRRTDVHLSPRQTIDKVGQLLGCGLVSKENQPMKCTTSKLLTCRLTNGGPTWSAFHAVSQSKNKAT